MKSILRNLFVLVLLNVLWIELSLGFFRGPTLDKVCTRTSFNQFDGLQNVWCSMANPFSSTYAQFETSSIDEKNLDLKLECEQHVNETECFALRGVKAIMNAESSGTLLVKAFVSGKIMVENKQNGKTSQMATLGRIQYFDGINRWNDTTMDDSIV